MAPNYAIGLGSVMAVGGLVIAINQSVLLRLFNQYVVKVVTKFYYF